MWLNGPRFLIPPSRERLRGIPLISDETSERVRQIALEMGYHPSAAARSLKTHQTKALGVVVRNIDDPFFSEILQGIEDVAQREGYSIFISSSQNDTQREQLVVQAMREHRVDGIIICSTSFSSGQSRQLLEYGVPIVVVNNQAAEEYRYSIYHDDVDGCRQLTRHLIELGHRALPTWVILSPVGPRSTAYPASGRKCGQPGFPSRMNTSTRSLEAAPKMASLGWNIS